MKVWKDHITEEAITVREKAVKAIKPKTIISCCFQMLCMTSRIYDRANQRNHVRHYGYGKNGRRVKGFKVWPLEKSNS